jgi:hypothetical protein
MPTDAGLDIRRMPLKKLQPWGRNPRRIDDVALAGLEASIKEFGLVEPVIWNEQTGHVVGGHQRLKVLLRQGVMETDVVVVQLPQEREAALNMALNNPAIAGLFTNEAEAILAELRQYNPALVDDLRLDEILRLPDLQGGGGASAAITGTGFKDDLVPELTMAQRFLVPPFSVLDARQGYWQDRKRAWVSLGIQSEIGRQDLEGGKAGGSSVMVSTFSPTAYGADVAVVSIFDPVLCEVAYRWFSPPGGKVLDPFAGGSVRGVVAGVLGRQYTGIDLSEKQLVANRSQWGQLAQRLQDEGQEGGQQP